MPIKRTIYYISNTKLGLNKVNNNNTMSIYVVLGEIDPPIDFEFKLGTLFYFLNAFWSYFLFSKLSDCERVKNHNMSLYNS